MEKLVDRLSQIQDTDPDRVSIILDVPQSLIYADKFDRYYQKLTEFEFLEAKINLVRSGVQELIRDYSLAAELEVIKHTENNLKKLRTLKLIQRALQYSAHILVKDKAHLSCQLWGRLQWCKEQDIQTLLEQARQKSDSPWLRPLTNSLTCPNGWLLSILHGHTDTINAVAVTPDGEQIISASADKTVRVWNRETGKIELILPGHTDAVNAVAVTPDGERIIAASADKTVRVWNRETGKPDDRIFKGYRYPIDAIVATSNDRLVISSSEYKKESILVRYLFKATYEKNIIVLRKELIMLDLKSGVKQNLKTEDLTIENATHLDRIDLHKLAKGVAITPDGKLAYSSVDNTIKILNLDTKRIEKTLPGHTDLINALAVTPDGKLVSGSFDRTIKIWNLATKRKLLDLTDRTDLINALAVTPDGKLVSGSSDRTIKIWNLKNDLELPSFSFRSLLFPFTDRSIPAKAVNVTHDGQCLIVTLSDGTIKTWNLKFGEQPRAFRDKPWGNYALTVHPNSKQVISSLNNGKLKIWNIKTGRQLFSLGSYFDYYRGLVNLIQSKKSDAEILFIKAILIVFMLLLFPFGSSAWHLFCFVIILLIFSLNVLINVIIKDDKSFEKLNVTVAITPNGEKIVAGSSWGNLRVWNYKTRKKLFTLKDKERDRSSIDIIAIAPDSQRLIFGSAERLKFWNLETQKELFSFEAHNAPINAVAFTPDGEQVVFGLADGKLQIWDLLSRQVSFTLKAHAASINAVAFTPNGKQMISGAADNTFKVWDWSSKKRLVSFIGDSEISCCTAAPEGMMIVTEETSERVDFVVGEKSGRVHFLQLGETRLKQRNLNSL